MIATVLLLDAGRLRVTHILPFAIPYLVGGAAYGAWAMSDIEGFKGQLGGNDASRRMAFLRHPLDAIIGEMNLYKYVFIGSQYDPGKFAPLKMVLLLTWFGGYLGQAFVGLKTRAGMVLTLCGAIPVVVLTFFNVRNDYYLIYIVPFFAANAAVLFVYLWRRGIPMRRFAAVAVAAVLTVNMAATGKRIVAARRQNVEFRRLATVASSMLPQGQRLIGPASYAFGVGMDRVVEDPTLGFYSRWCPALMIVYGLAPNEVENLRQGAPEVLAYRDRIVAVYYKSVDGPIYQRVSCPPGAHEDYLATR